MKVTFYQRKIPSTFNKEDLTRLSKERSDFLLLPPGIVTGKDKAKDASQKYDENLDSILEVSSQFKGVVIGPTLFRESNKQLLESIPLASEASLIDHYDIRNPSEKGLAKGDSEIAFIMAGVRFSILAGLDLDDQSLLNEISGKGIQTIFYLDSKPVTRSYDEDLDYFSELTKKRNWNIFRICGYQEGESTIRGRSLFATPSGIQWKVGNMEEERTILKTIHFAQANPFL